MVQVLVRTVAASEPAGDGSDAQVAGAGLAADPGAAVTGGLHGGSDQGTDKKQGLIEARLLPVRQAAVVATGDAGAGQAAGDVEEDDDDAGTTELERRKGKGWTPGLIGAAAAGVALAVAGTALHPREGPDSPGYLAWTAASLAARLAGAAILVGAAYKYFKKSKKEGVQPGAKQKQSQTEKGS